MHVVNLIPPAILDKRRQRRAIASWCVAAAICLLASGAMVLFVHNRQQPAKGPDLEPELMRVQREVDQVQAQQIAVSQLINATHQQAQAAGAVSGQPDWQQLLTVMAYQLGDKAVVTLFDIGPATAPNIVQSAGLTGNEASGIWLVIGGVAQDHFEVPGLVLRLEELGLFMKVTLVETTRISFEGSERTAFRIRCQLR